MKPTGYSAFKAQLLGKPSIVGTGVCAACGRRSTDRHHVIQKGIGGVSPEVEARIPKIELCRNCHDAVHARRLHLYWFDRMGWAGYESPYAMDDQIAVTQHEFDFKVLPGWTAMQYRNDVIGAGR